MMLILGLSASAVESVLPAASKGKKSACCQPCFHRPATGSATATAAIYKIAAR